MALLFFILNYKYIISLNILIHNRLTYQLLTLCEHLIHIHMNKENLKGDKHSWTIMTLLIWTFNIRLTVSLFLRKETRNCNIYKI